MNTTLLIMAAGIGSRFGTGIKQLEPVDGKRQVALTMEMILLMNCGMNITPAE